MRIDDLPTPALDARDLRLLVALIEGRTTNAAAGALHLTQSSVSRALLSLEERVGAHLFDRTSRGLVATPACARMATRGAELLRELDELARSVHDPEPVTRIRLVAECHTAYHWLPTALVSLRKEIPDVDLSIRMEHAADPVRAMHDDALDAALVISPTASTRTLEVESLFADEMVFVVGESHPLAKRKTLTPRDLTQHRLLTARPTSGEQTWFLEALFGRKRPRLTVSWVPLTEAIADMTRAGMGIGILTEWVARPHLDAGGLVPLRVRGKKLERPWSLAWRRELGDLGALLAEALRAHEAAV